jgi:hypothetical protein
MSYCIIINIRYEYKQNTDCRRENVIEQQPVLPSRCANVTNCRRENVIEQQPVHPFRRANVIESVDVENGLQYENKYGFNTITMFTENQNFNTCVICEDRKANAVLPCGHMFCPECVSKLINCSVCREQIDKRKVNVLVPRS